MLKAMTYFPEVSRTLALTGGILVSGAMVFAETVSTDPSIGAGSVLLGGASLVAAISAFSKDFWQDRQKQRDHDLAKLRIRSRNDKSTLAIEALLDWARTARAAVATLPPAPEISLKMDDDHDV